MKSVSGSFLLLLVLAVSVTPVFGGSTLCVDPDDGGCFSTIQEAVLTATPSTTITVRAKADGTPYNETVIVDTPDLIIEGETAPVFGIANFNDLLGLDWETERNNCPQIRVDACETSELGDSCGFYDHPTATEGERSAFVVNASNVTIRHFTIRHALYGVRFGAGSDDGAASLNCFIHNRRAVYAGTEGEDEVDNLNISRNRLFGIDTLGISGAAVQIFGNESTVELNLLRLSEGFFLLGDAHTLQLNAIHHTAHSKGIFLEKGSSGLVNENWAMGTDSDGIYLDEYSNSTVSSNRVTDVPDDDAAIYLINGSDNNMVIGNTTSGTSDNGFEISNSSGNTIQDNTVSSSGSDGNEACIMLTSVGPNSVLGNDVSLCGVTGIMVTNNKGTNVVAGNEVQWAGTNGIHMNNGSSNTIDNNTTNNNAGEGISNDAASSNTVITNNISTGNLTDICNNGTIATFAANTFDSGGDATPCEVEP